MQWQPAQLQQMYRQMVTIRRFEEAVRDLYTSGQMPGLAHTSAGQEAVAVGACAVLRPDDYIVSNHRGHGHCIAKGASLDRMAAELLGKVTGYCRGKGGTMHIAAVETNNLGATGIVGGGIGTATGVGLSARLRGTDQVVVCFFGDGASNEGLFHESLNLAAIWQLPVVFLCENNQYGEYTAGRSVTAGTAIAERAASYGLPGGSVDGMDPLAVAEAVSLAVARARSGGGPSLLECVTYRFHGHHVGDPGAYRTREELDAWRQRDPIPRFRSHLQAIGVLGPDEADRLDGEAARAVEQAVVFAQQSPFPPLSEVEEHVYA